MDNNANNSRKFIIRSHRKLGFFKAWLLLGIVMMLLNATIWPEVSTDPNICWFYQVATLWITMVNKVCQFFFPALQTAGEWLTNLVINIFEWIGANWPAITSVAHKWLQFSISFTVNSLIFMAFIIVLCVISIALTYLLDKKEGKKIINDIIKEIKDEWDNFCKRTFRHKFPEGEAISKTPTAGNPEAGAASGADNSNSQMNEA